MSNKTKQRSERNIKHERECQSAAGEPALMDGTDVLREGLHFHPSCKVTAVAPCLLSLFLFMAATKGSADHRVNRFTILFSFVFVKKEIVQKRSDEMTRRRRVEGCEGGSM